MTNPIDKKTLQEVMRWLGTPLALVVLLIVAKPYWIGDKDSPATTADNSFWSGIEQRVEAHARQSAADQRATADELQTIEALLRDLVDHARTNNTLQRQRMQFEKCLVADQVSDKVCAGAVR
jgi:hypothetical protein